MRNVLISLAVTASALAVAAPASAQYAPPPPPGYAYGHNNNYGQVRSLQARIDRVQRRIDRLSERRALSRNEARGLRAESRSIERRLRAVASFGLHPRERRDIEVRIARLEQHVRHEARDGRRGHGYVYDQNAYGYFDRDRDGRDDRYEDDRGGDRDGRRERN